MILVQEVVYLIEQNLVVEGVDAERLLAEPEYARREWTCQRGDRAEKQFITKEVEITEVAKHRYRYTGQKVERMRILSTKAETLSTYKFVKRGGKWMWMEAK